MYSQNDPDAYSFSGGLNRTTQGLMEFVEMFKAPVDAAPALDRDAGGQLRGTENIGGIPFQGIILAHSNEGRSGRTQKQQEQRSLYRPHLGHQGAVLPARRPRSGARSTKLLQSSELSNAAVCAVATLDILSRVLCAVAAQAA